MSASNSEARKSREAAKAVATVERRREIVRDALGEVYSGASFTDADALLDQLETLGARVVIG